MWLSVVLLLVAAIDSLTNGQEDDRACNTLLVQLVDRIWYKRHDLY